MIPGPALFRAAALLFLHCALLAVNAQRQHPDTLRAVRLAPTEEVVFDGVPDEPFWARAMHINEFRQRDPHQDSLATDTTDVAVVYDGQALWFGARLHVAEPDRMIAKYMQRDFAYWSDDNFQFIISTFNDRRTGYNFITNPNGARADVLIGSRSERNMDWNGVWDVRTACTPDGWTCEFRIPFSTLQFRKDSVHTWALNFERNVRCRNEQCNWQGWGRNTAVENLATAGTLTGLKDIGYTKRFELKPYLLGGLQQQRDAADEWPGKVGGDLNVNITPTLKLNLTSNTDFAQVEVDRAPVNLTRFNFFFPEKREFFLEGSANYAFSLDGNNQVFYTRRIGIEDGAAVPVLGGARLFGKLGRNNIGVLNIQTGSADSVPTTNNTVLRYKRDIGEQSFLGGIFTNKLNSTGRNQVVGVDGGYGSSRFLGNKVVDLQGFLTQSITDGRQDKDGLAAGLYAAYPNDLIDAALYLGTVQEGFNPELGFLARKGYEIGFVSFNYTPRWFTKQGVRKMDFVPIEYEVYRTPGTGELQSWSYGFRPFGVLMNSGDELGLNFNWYFDRVPEAFNLTDEIRVEPGAYHWNEASLVLSTFRGRRWQFVHVPTLGTFYNGRKFTLDNTVVLNFNKHLNLNIEHTWNQLDFPAGTEAPRLQATTHELALFPVYAFNPRLSLSVFGQWNSLSDLVRVNARLHWIPRIGSDLFLVLDESHSPVNGLDLARPANRSMVGKLVWRFAF